MPLTGTRWDALLAAMVEHVAGRHGLGRVESVHEPERFLDEAWVLSPIPIIRRQALRRAPAAFLRDGTILDPRGSGHPRRGEQRVGGADGRERPRKRGDERRTVSGMHPGYHEAGCRNGGSR